MSDKPEGPHVFKPSSAVYTPSEVSTYGVNTIEKIESGTYRSIDIGIPGLKGYFAPMLPGQILTVVAQTSQYKSGTLRFIAYNIAQYLSDPANHRQDECVLFVTLEETIEELSFFELAWLSTSNEEAGLLAQGKVKDWQSLKAAAVSIAGIPIYRIGPSMTRAKQYPLLYISNLERSIDYAVKTFNLKPAFLILDYLNALPPDPNIQKTYADRQNRFVIKNNLLYLKSLAGKFACPAAVGVQAPKKLDGAPSPDFMIPGVFDVGESKEIADISDRMITQWMPKMTHTIGRVLHYNDITFKVEENLMWQKVAKQKLLPSGRTWKMRIDYKTGRYAPEASVEESQTAPVSSKSRYNGGDENSLDDITL